MFAFGLLAKARLAARYQENARCAQIALRWMRDADAKLGAGWRTSRDLAIAARVAKGIADEIISTIEDNSDA